MCRTLSSGRSRPTRSGRRYCALLLYRSNNANANADAGLQLIPFALVLSAALCAAAVAAKPEQPSSPPPAGVGIGLADSAGLRATVFGTPPQDMASLPAKVPLSKSTSRLPWHLPVPRILCFDAKLRVWFSAQDKPAPLAIVISGTGQRMATPKQFPSCGRRCTARVTTY